MSKFSVTKYQKMEQFVSMLACGIMPDYTFGAEPISVHAYYNGIPNDNKLNSLMMMAQKVLYSED